MAETAAGIMVDTLLNWGVEVIFGLPGDGINGLMEGLRQTTRQDPLYPSAPRRSRSIYGLRLCEIHGASWGVPRDLRPRRDPPAERLYDAKLDGQPVLAITGHHYHDLIDTHAQQDVDLDRVFMDVAVYNTRIMGPATSQHVDELACRTALLSRGRAHQLPGRSTGT